MRGVVFGFAAAVALASAASAACSNQGPAVQDVAVPGAPFASIPSADGCTIYVSLRTEDGRGAIAIVSRTGGKPVLTGTVSTPAPLWGLSLTRDGALLIAADGKGATFVDTHAATVQGAIADGGKDTIYTAVTPDETLLFVSDEHSRGIGVIDLAKARSGGFSRDAAASTIPVWLAPVGLAVSPDGRALFATVEIANQPEMPRTCPSENGRGGEHHEGALLVIDTQRAKSDPTHAVVAFAYAGCNPVRVALSPKADRAYVTARGSNALLVFDTAKLVTQSKTAQIASVPVGKSPVGVAVTPDGKTVVVSNSDRFADDGAHKSVTFVDAAKAETGAAAVLGSVDVGAFPRELSITADGTTLIVANARSASITLIDLKAVTLKPPTQP
jgi:DNA-binding beta-propeller fold protein YncE